MVALQTLCSNPNVVTAACGPAGYADGQPCTFKLYREYHEKRQYQRLLYVFAAYRIRGKGRENLAHGNLRASKRSTSRWHGRGDHRGTEQAKLAMADVL